MNKTMKYYVSLMDAMRTREGIDNYFKDTSSTGNVFIHKKEDIEGAYIETDDSLYIVFRSTEFDNFREVLDNFNINKTSINSTRKKVHSGLYDKYQYETRDYINKLVLSKKKKVYLIGHSLGGGLSMIAGIHIRNTKNIRQYLEKIITIGSYTVCNKYAYDDIADYCENYILSKDVSLIFSKLLNVLGYTVNYKVIKQKGFFYRLKNHYITKYKDIIFKPI